MAQFPGSAANPAARSKTALFQHTLQFHKKRVRQPENNPMETPNENQVCMSSFFSCISRIQYRCLWTGSHNIQPIQ